MNILACDICRKTPAEHCNICGRDLCFLHKWSHEHSDAHAAKKWAVKVDTELGTTVIR